MPFLSLCTRMSYLPQEGEISEIHHPISPLDVTHALTDRAQLSELQSQNQYQMFPD